MRVSRKHVPLILGEIVMILIACLSFGQHAHGQTARNPIQPDPRQGTWRRPALCSHFDVSRAPICNTNPDSYSTQGDCLTVTFSSDGLAHIRCPEDSPRYYEALRRLDFAMTCGENGRMCLDAYVFRHGDRCVYSVVGDSEPTNRYDIRIRELSNWQGVQVHKAGTSTNRNLESKHRRQERNMRYSANHPNAPNITVQYGDCD